MKKIIATLTCALLLAASVCHAVQDKVHVVFYDYSRTEFSEQIKNNIIKHLEAEIEIVGDALDSYVGEIHLNIIITENPEHVIFFYYMFYKGRFIRGFYTGSKAESEYMCRNIVSFYIETFFR